MTTEILANTGSGKGLRQAIPGNDDIRSKIQLDVE